MNDDELEYWRLAAAVQELFGASDIEVKAQKEVGESIDVVARLIQKWRKDKRQKEEVRMRMHVLKEVGIPVIGPKRK